MLQNELWKTYGSVSPSRKTSSLCVCSPCYLPASLVLFKNGFTVCIVLHRDRFYTPLNYTLGVMRHYKSIES